MISNIPKGMVTDQFGMIGLLTFIRAAETEPNLVTLALGRSVEILVYVKEVCTFQTPWSAQGNSSFADT